jgi:tetratricopeptide (TPR) repeat protein
MQQENSVSKVSAATLEKFQEILAKDPKSKVFAPLADAYRELGLLEEAEEVASKGTRLHPGYVSGFVAYGRILMERKKWPEALPALTKAAELDPQNLLALHLLGNLHLQLKQPKLALKNFKMVLFLNPHSEKARKAIEKLESLSADEFEEDVFEMKQVGKPKKDPSQETVISKISQGFRLERQLSLIDALIVRNDLAKAREHLEELRFKNPDNREVQNRWNLLFEDAAEIPAPLSPNRDREMQVLARKKKRLEAVLQSLENERNQRGLSL